jgi:catechol 2,3-dioxygenase-like lactoylglutathione lyase family enzyme
MLKSIAHVCIAATDLAATEQFYCSGLGCRKVFDFVRRGERIGFYLAVGNTTFIEAFRHDTVDTKAKAPIQHMCLEVDDIDDMSCRLKSCGYQVTDKKLGADQSWQTWTADPSGVRIEFHQYTPQSSQITGQNCALD